MTDKIDRITELFRQLLIELVDLFCVSKDDEPKEENPTEEKPTDESPEPEPSDDELPEEEFTEDIDDEFIEKNDPEISINELAEEVLDGKWGSGDARKKRLEEAGYDYYAVQARVNDILNVVDGVLEGKWGSGDTRKQRLVDAGYDYYFIQKLVTERVNNNTKEKLIENMNAWATKIAADNTFHYKVWKANDEKTHLCPICKKYPEGKYHGWNCIGFVYAVWHHGGGLKCRCNCGVISNGISEKMLKASDAEALRIAKEKIGLNDIKVIKNTNGIPKSQWQAGDICLKFNGNTYTHNFYYMGNGKVADSTGSSGKVPNDKQIAIRDYKNYSCKIIIRYTGLDKK